jgi:hypothetical protein
MNSRQHVHPSFPTCSLIHESPQTELLTLCKTFGINFPTSLFWWQKTARPAGELQGQVLLRQSPN